MQADTLLRVIAKILLPYIFLFALYVLFHGKYSPGGGFQAGVIAASAFILYSLIFGMDALNSLLSPSAQRIGACLGVLLYGAVGLEGFNRLNSSFLCYKCLAYPPQTGEFWGIMLVETGIGLTVMMTMVAIYSHIVSWKPEELKPETANPDAPTTKGAAHE